jgi:formylglycine-generating enzyme required for sulfatase activity
LEENPGIRAAYRRYTGARGDLPAANVTLYEAIQYCRWLSKKEGLPETEMCYPAIEDIDPGRAPPTPELDRIGYRLLLDMEWEYAARAGTLTSRAFGDSEEMLKYYAWYLPNASAQPTGRLKPNDFGLFDMYGNVCEWCVDRAPTFEHGLRWGSETKDNLFVWRGGAFLSQADRVRSATVASTPAATRAPTLGFRIARTVR